MSKPTTVPLWYDYEAKGYRFHWPADKGASKLPRVLTTPLPLKPEFANPEHIQQLADAEAALTALQKTARQMLRCKFEFEVLDAPPVEPVTPTQTELF